MILNEAIERYTSNAEYERIHGNLQGCLDFRQLAEWLKEYERLLEQEPCNTDTCKVAKAYMNEWDKPNNSDAISRQAVQDYIAKYLSQYLYNDVREAVEVIDEYIGELPSVNPQSKTGYWIGIDEEPHEDYECSCCGYVVSTFTANIEPHTEYKYCPHCGAKMESEE